MITDGDESRVPDELVASVRSICCALAEVHEEPAWVGTRWRIRTRTFAHIVRIESGYPPGYARALGSDGPAIVLMFRSSGPELDALRNSAAPFFTPPWRQDEIGMVIDEHTDWTEVAELLTESYCVQAPRKLAKTVLQPAAAPPPPAP